MDSFLLLSLFITHLAVGGELLQYSATDIIYVSKDGTDNSSCLNGESHCKTLGYVLTNIPILQCTNCTVTVTYDHVVGPLSNTPYIVNISSIEALYIIGLGQPNLDFNGSGLKLVNTDNNTSVIIENFKVSNCKLGGFTCTFTDGIDNGNSICFLLKFTLINVMVHNGRITVVAKSVHYHSSHFKNDYYGNDFVITAPGAVDSKIVLLNNTFHNTLSIDISDDSQNLSKKFVVIRQCHFIGTMQAVNLTAISCLLNFTMENCQLDTCTAASFCVQLNFYGEIMGGASIANNHFTKNRCYRGSVGCTYLSMIYHTSNSPQTKGSICYSKVTIRCHNNTFFDNMAIEILHFQNLANIDIGNATFINNIVNDDVVSVQCNGKQHTNIVIHNSTFLNNSIVTLPTANKGAIMRITVQFIESSITIFHLNFTNNTGTPLSIMGSSVKIVNDITFINNNAITGGGMYFTANGHVTIADNATISFINNFATYGGAIYIDQNYCFVYCSEGSVVFVANQASSGPSIYSSYNWCSFNSNCIARQNITNIASLPTAMSFNSNNTTSLFPGQTIVGDMTVVDCFGNASSCLADVSLQCDEKGCNDYRIIGPSTIFLSNGTANTGLKIISKHVSFKKYPQLKLVCKSPIRQLPLVLTVDITVLPCPLGFAFNSLMGQCECINNGNEYFICNKDVGLVCVKKGYWYSNYSGTASKCIHLFCDFSEQRKKCPPSVSPDPGNYLLLGSSQDDQCIDGHGGTLCTGCALNKLPTYGALQCIDSNKCTRWHPYILMLLNITIPFIDGVFLMIIIRLKLSIGSGYLYGPLFYLAVLNLIPLTSYSTLNTIISSFADTLLLKLKFLGYIPWCFFPSVSLLTSKWFELIGPSVVAVVLLLTVYLARCSPKLLEHFQKSLLQAMCVLVLVLFWSLASTSISVITPVYLSGVEGPRVHLQPDVVYLRGDHIPLWIISVIILLMLYSIVFVLTFSRFLNLHRFKPILDEFQSCYKDSYRWYGGVYFIMWTILQVLVISSNYELFQTVIIVLTVTHCLLQPYCKKWLNMMDGLFLGSLSISSCLLSDSGTMLNVVLVYISAMVPLCIISLGVVFIVIVRFKILSKLISEASAITKKSSHTQTPVTQPNDMNFTRSVLDIEGSDNNYREPLLHYIQDSASDYHAINN